MKTFKIKTKLNKNQKINKLRKIKTTQLKYLYKKMQLFI